MINGFECFVETSQFGKQRTIKIMIKGSGWISTNGVSGGVERVIQAPEQAKNDGSHIVAGCLIGVKAYGGVKYFEGLVVSSEYAESPTAAGVGSCKVRINGNRAIKCGKRLFASHKRVEHVAEIAMCQCETGTYFNRVVKSINGLRVTV